MNNHVKNREDISVLIIDDEESVRLSFKNYLLDLDYQVFEAENGEEGLLIFDRENPDVVFTDLRMPGISGVEVSRIIHEKKPEIPIVIISGYGVLSEFIDAFKVGAWDYILKPVESLSHLDIKIHAVMEKSEMVKEIHQYQTNLEVLVDERTAELKRINNDLLESEKRYKQLADNAPVGITVVTDGEIVYTNPFGARLYGASKPKEFYGRNMMDFIHPDYRQIAVRRMKNITGERKPARYLGIKLNGEYTQVEAISSMVEYKGKPSLQIVYLDISERVESEKKIQNQIKRLNALHKIDEMIMSNTDMEATLKFTFEKIRETLEIDAVNVYLHDKDAHLLVHKVSVGFQAPHRILSEIRIGKGFSGRTIIEQKPIHIQNIQKMTPAEESFPENWKEEGFVEFVGVPLITKGEYVGVVELLSRKPFASDENWWSFMETIIGQVSIAVDNGLLFEKLTGANFELNSALNHTLEAWAQTLEKMGIEPMGHSQRLVRWLVELALQFNVPHEDIVNWQRGAVLHDIGMCSIPEEILKKTTELNEEDWLKIKKHPEIGKEVISKIPYLESSNEIPFCHHERWDGSGYPRKLREYEIPLSARIFAVIDVWDSLRSPKSFRPAWTKVETEQYLKENAGVLFDPKVVEKFLKINQ